MPSKPITRFLLQERKGQTPCIYAWTPTLAQRPDMRQITADQARDMVKDARKEAERQAEELKAAELKDYERQNPIVRSLEEEYPEQEIKPVIDQIAAVEHGAPGVSESVTPQDSLLAEEYKKVTSFRKALTLEEYLLKKYRVELLPKDLEEMKLDAKAILGSLAQEQKLYKLVD